MTSESFYADLQPFSDFHLTSSPNVYQAVPNDWLVIITDVEGSTKAIADGRYRDINFIGAGAIALAQSVFHQQELAFVFGGDGATFLIPPSKRTEIEGVFARYRAFCARQYQLNLRVGIVRVEDILNAGQKLEAAKFSGAGRKCTAFLRGGGLRWAEAAVKSSPERYGLKDDPNSDRLAFEGLSCRWEPIASGKGAILTLLAQPRMPDETKVLERLINELGSILGGTLESANPVQTGSLKYGGFWRSLAREWRLRGRFWSKSFLWRVTEMALCQMAFRFHLPVPFAANEYMSRLHEHSDYRKYDDTLRLVLDCSTEQAAQIERCLEGSFQRGEIYYGIVRSSHALMTCLVENIGAGGHIHLIDGSDGGYSLAAQRLTLQRRAA